MQSSLAFPRSLSQHCLISKFQNHSIKLDIYAIEIRKGIFYSATGFGKNVEGKMSVTLVTILKDSEYRLSQFENTSYIAELENKIVIKTDKTGKQICYLPCLIRKKDIKVTPSPKHSYALTNARK